ncbi:MAG: hypothetical protein MCSN_6040 [Candidatus Microsyncoccus archaeolyticus]|jgi:hypothetical protein|nr:MAG: hypothetical protein MCSN_6040 [Candidatus Parcubacteria bacterium]
MNILIRKVEKQKIISNKRTLLFFIDGSNIMIRAGDFHATMIDYRDAILIFFKEKAKIQEIMIAKCLDKRFYSNYYAVLLRANKKGRFWFDHRIDSPYYLPYYYGNCEAIDFREGFPKKIIIPNL